MHDAKPTSTAKTYRDIFELRGRWYHQAMETFSDARSQEFLSVIAKADLAPRMTIVDVPSGGAYVSQYINDAHLIGLETSQSFAQLAAANEQCVVLYENDSLPLEDDSIDRVLSIAGLHHVENKTPIFNEMRRITKPNGRIVLADAAEDCAVRYFLDDFVGEYSETGHSGWYFGDDTRLQLQEAGLTIVKDERLKYLWCAPDLNQLAEFCRMLFGMTLADTETIAKGLVERLGVCEVDGQVGMNWQLHCFTCEKQPKAEHAL